MNSATSQAPRQHSEPADGKPADGKPNLQIVREPMFLADIADIALREAILADFVKNHMKEGHDYGIIPRTDNKKVLKKPGAEKICAIFGVAPLIEITNRVEIWDPTDGFFAYEAKITLQNKRSKSVEAHGVGACNSKENKYKNQSAFQIQNTILRMAKKRAMVDATISMSCVSGMFEAEGDDEDDGVNAPRNNAQQGGYGQNRSQQNRPDQNRPVWNGDNSSPGEARAYSREQSRQSENSTPAPAAPAAAAPRCHCGIAAQYLRGKPGKAGGYVCGHYPGDGRCNFLLKDGQATAQHGAQHTEQERPQ